MYGNIEEYVVSAAQNGKFERFGGFCVDCYYTI